MQTDPVDASLREVIVAKLPVANKVPPDNTINGLAEPTSATPSGEMEVVEGIAAVLRVAPSTLPECLALAMK